MSLNIGIGINDDLAKIIMDESLTLINKAIELAQPSIQNRLSQLVVDAVQDSPSYKSILNGDLGAELGIADPGSVLSDMDALLAKSIFFEYTKFRYPKASLSGKFTIGIIRDDFKEFLTAPFGVYISEGKSGAWEIAWLKWLLTQGDKIIISDYHVVFGSGLGFSEFSRTGRALMFSGGSWGVPAEHAGTIKDNFITRALTDSSFQTKASEIITAEIQKNI